MGVKRFYTLHILVAIFGLRGSNIVSNGLRKILAHDGVGKIIFGKRNAHLYYPPPPTEKKYCKFGLVLLAQHLPQSKKNLWNRECFGRYNLKSLLWVLITDYFSPFELFWGGFGREFIAIWWDFMNLIFFLIQISKIK